MKRIKPFHLIFAIAAIFYGASSSLYPFPGESTSLLVSHGWVYPFQLLSLPLWGSLIWTLDLLPFPIAATMNAVSVLCGALSIALFHSILMNCLMDSDYDEKTPMARKIMAASGALYLMVLLPTWIISNRAHNASFEMLMLLILVRLLQIYRERGGRARLALMAALLGLGVVESSSVLVAAPVLGLYLIFLMWKNSDIGAFAIAIVAGSFILAILFFIIPTAIYTTLPVYEWGGARNFFHALWLTYSSSARNLSSQVRQVGWIMLIMVSLIPFVGAVWVKKGQPVENRQFSLMLISLIVTALSGTLLFNVRIAPWVLLPSTLGLVLPEIMIAMAFAVSAAFWFATFKYHRKRKHSRGYNSRGVRVDVVFVILILALLVTGAALNFGKVRPQVNRELYQVARQIAKALPPRDTVLTFSGNYDRQLVLAAHDLGIDCDIINFKMANMPLYRKYIAQKLDSTRLSSLMGVSLSAMIHEWLSETPGINHRVAIHGNPRLWERSGYRPVAQSGLYYGMRGEDVDPMQLHSSQEEFWRLARRSLRFDPEADTTRSQVVSSIAFDMARNINDLGVLFEFMERPELAKEAYETAYAVNDSNISIIANLHTITQDLGGETDALRERAMQSIKKISSTSARQIMDTFGYIRREESFIFLSELYAEARDEMLATDQVDLEYEESEMLDVDGLDPSSLDANAIVESEVEPSQEDIEDFQLAMEKIQEGDLEGAQVVLRDLVQRETRYNRVWVLKAMVSNELQDYDSVQRCIEQMLKVGEFWPQLGVIMGQMALRDNEMDRARNAFEAVLMNDPQNVRILEELIRLDSVDGPSRRGEAYLSALLGLDSGNYLANFMLGHKLYLQGEIEAALAAYEKAAHRSRTPEVLNNIAWVLHVQGEDDLAMYHARESLEMNRRISPTWNTMASIHLRNGSLQEAEYSVMQALRLNENNVGARITMVGIEMARENYDKAQEMAHEIKEDGPELSEDQAERLEDFQQRAL